MSVEIENRKRRDLEYEAEARRKIELEEEQIVSRFTAFD